MHPKLRGKYRRALLGLNLLFVVFFLSCNKESDSPAQNGIYSNGTMSTGSVCASGVSAPVGTTWSEAQADVSSNVSNWSVGIGNFYNNNTSIWVGDDFTIPSGQTWNISKIAFYGMEWSATSNPFDGLRLQIWKGKPGVSGSLVIYGDATTNVLSNVIDSLIYGIPHSSIPSPGIVPDLLSKFWKLEANANLTLSSGTYWITWQTHTVRALSAFSPFVVVKNIRTQPSWNAILSSSPGIWIPLTNPGRPTSAPQVLQDLPFEIVYTY